MNPEEHLIAAFWKCLHDDLIGRGCTSDNLPYEQRRLPYYKRVTIERGNLQKDALLFIDSLDFNLWATQSGLNVDYLRTQFHALPN